MEWLATWFLIFMIYSFLGWVMEVIGSIIFHHKFVNRGFLIGTICPIYGVGAVGVSLLLRDLSNPLLIFCIGFVGSAILEYLVSYSMEKLFHVRWWDYSKMPFNINGRICLQNLIGFGLIALLIHCFATPWFLSIIRLLPDVALFTLAGILAVWFIIDIALSLWLMFNVRVTVGIVAQGDATEEISTRVHEALMNKGKLNRRLVKAFPNQQPSKKKPRPRKPKAESMRKASKPKRTSAQQKS